MYKQIHYEKTKKGIRRCHSLRSGIGMLFWQKTFTQTRKTVFFLEAGFAGSIDLDKTSAN